MPSKANDPLERLVFVTTEDGLELEGLLITPQPGRGSGPLVIWVHGMHRRFSQREFVEIGRHVARLGLPFLAVNTRGHDLGAWFRTPKGFLLGGTAWEQFIDSPFDIAAWTELARKEGFKNYVLVGVGYGAPKVVFYQVQRQDRHTAGCVFASSGTIVRDKITDLAPAETTALAKRMIAEGRGQELMAMGAVKDSFGSTVSAQVYADRARIHREFYGEAGDRPPALAQIRQPIFVLYGGLAETRERPLQDFIERIRRTAVQSPEVKAKIIEGASNTFVGFEAAAAREICGWISQTLSLPKAV
ncbi:alpha/beta hydrolase [Pelagibius sp.]|uniref:alpha/beta hydrolase n=1 Tax=Pelagibius sp. TaxID=1931238 RepID=UPI00261B5E57|nr:alpha/beta hydrolase [Pelagibius sp.]